MGNSKRAIKQKDVEKKRLVWADSLKGLLIILVVLGHAIQNTLGVDCDNNHIWNAIYSFHMPAFMAISGYLAYRPNSQWGGQNLISVLYRRFRQLIVPFVIWTLLLLLVGGKFTSENIGFYLLYPDKGLWFLWVLFFITVFFNFGNWISERIHFKQEVVLAVFCLMFAGSMVAFEIRVLGFQFLAYYFIIYSLGYFLHKYYDEVVTKNTFVILLLVVCWGILAWFWKMHELPSWLQFVPLPTSLMQYAYRFITAALAIYILMAIAPNLMNSKNKWNAPFINLGGISLGIYTVHFILTGRIVSLYRNWMYDDTLAILLSFITALMVSWGVVWLLSKWKFTARWFLGKI